MRLVAGLLLAFLSSSMLQAAPAKVLLVVVDGLGAGEATADLLPRLTARATARRATRASARAVLPARTNPNHASMLTGRWPDGHGVVGNTFWDVEHHVRRAMDDPAMLEGETLFDVLAKERPHASTAAYFGKGKLRRLFGPAPGLHAGPGVRWTPGSDYASDDTVVDAVADHVERDGLPDFTVVGVADVDRLSHAGGPASAAVRSAIEHVDDLLDGLLDVIARRGEWDRTVVIVTADHGFAPVAADGVLVLPVGSAEDGVTWIDEGRLAFGHGWTPSSGVVRAPITVPSGMVRVVTDLAPLGLRHPRAGSVMLTAPPGFAFAARGSGYALRGDHGGEEERAIPLIVLGGAPSLRRLRDGVVAEVPDVAPTVAAMLGVRPPQGGRPEGRRGRRLPIWDP